MIDVHAVNKKSKESTQILARCKQKKARFKQKKKSKESTQTLTIRKEKMIDVHAVNQKKTKKVHKFLQYERKKNDCNAHCKPKKKKNEIFAEILCREYMFIVK